MDMHERNQRNVERRLRDMGLGEGNENTGTNNDNQERNSNAANSEGARSAHPRDRGSNPGFNENLINEDAEQLITPRNVNQNQNVQEIHIRRTDGTSDHSGNNGANQSPGMVQPTQQPQPAPNYVQTPAP